MNISTSRSRLALVLSLLVAAGAHAAEGNPPAVQDLADGLWLHYTFDVNSTNTTLDVSGNGRNGIAYGATWTSNGWLGSGMLLDGVNDYVGRSDVIGGLQNGTVGLWFKPRTWTLDVSHRGLITTTIATSPVEPWDGLLLGANSVDGNDAQVRFGLYDYPNRLWNWAASGVVPQPGNWYHFLGTWGVDGIRCYVNGELLGTNSYVGVPALRNLLMIGRQSWANSYADGAIDDVRIYQRTLRPDEVMELFLTGGGVVTTSSTSTSSTSTSTTSSSSTTATSVALVWQQVTNVAPWAGRSVAAGVVHDERLWLMAGRNAGGRLNDVWSSVDGSNWLQATNAAAWAKRYGAGAASHDGKLWLLGGADQLFMNDVWYSEDGAQWLQATNAAPWGVRYLAGVFAWDGKLWVMGGEAAGAQVGGGVLDYADIWNSTDGREWTQVASNAPWGGRMSMGVIKQEGRLWLLGGYGGGVARNDVWTSTNGVDWTQVTPAAAWSTRWDAGAVAHDGKLWLMGGLRANASRLNDVWWSEDGATWHQTTHPADWSVRSSALWRTFAGKIWALGGETVRLQVFGDVWRTPWDDLPPLTTSTTSTSTTTESTTTTETSTSDSTTTESSTSTSSTTTTAPLVLVPLAQALDQTGLAWNVGGTAGWFGQTSVSHDGVDAARSGVVGHNQQSRLQTVVTGPTTLGFWWRLSAETNDTLTFAIGIDEQFRAGGTQQWRWEGFYIPSGVHTVRWTYAKDASGTAGSDAAWVDKVAVGLWGEARDTSGGWRYTDWFGYVYPSAGPWVYHNQHGWLYAFGTDPASVVFWDSEMQRYWWTSDSAYSYMYRFGDNAWLWYQPNSDNPRVFLNTKTGVWEKW